MEIPRLRQHAHIPRMTVHAGLRMLHLVGAREFLFHSAIIRQPLKFYRAVDQPRAHKVGDTLRAPLHAALHQQEP